MHRLVRVGVLVAGTAAAALIPAATAKMPAPLPAQEAVATPQTTDGFKPAAHPTIRIVLGEAGFATVTGREGALECLPEDQTVKLSPSAITVKGPTIQVDFGPREEVRAVIVGDYHTVDIALMNAAARHGNALGVPDVEFDRGFVDGSEVAVKLCVPAPKPSRSS